MKKIILSILFVFIAVILVGCDVKTKELSKGGITITLPTSFKEGKADNAQVYYVSKNAMFMGNRFEKTDYPPTIRYSAGDHQAFADHLRNDELLDYNGKPAPYSELETSNDGSSFAYLYYDKTVNDVEYSYMLVVKTTNTYFYIMNFASLKKDFEKYQDDFMEYAKTIVVED